MDDLQFDKRVWSLHEALHWIAFGRHDVPATEDSATRFEQAEVGLLGEWQDGNISPRGCEKGSGTPQEIPRDFSTKAEFEPIGNSIYQEGWGQPEPRWKEVCFFRADVLALWPDIPWPDQSAPQMQEAPEPSDKKEKPPAKRKRNVEADAKLRSRIEMVFAMAKTEWPNKSKRPGIKTMAKHLVEKNNKKKHGFSFETLRQILRGTYPALERLKIRGL